MAISNTFEGKTALITGAASGIGKSCAEFLAANGAEHLILIDLSEDGLAAIDLDCATSLIAGDVGDQDLWARVAAKHPKYDHAVVNAGIGVGGMIKDLDLAEWRRVMNVNLDGAFLTLANAMRAMEAAGGGSAAVVSSASAIKPVPGLGPYGVSKAAVAHMAKIAALEGAPLGIRVNAIAPGGVDTAIWESSEDFRKLVEDKGREAALAALSVGIPRGELASSAEIAETIGYLLSDAARNITGSVMVSDGGYTL